jgi:hypothetical protein
LSGRSPLCTDVAALRDRPPYRPIAAARVPARLWVVRNVGIPQGLPLTFSRPSFSSIDDPGTARHRRGRRHRRIPAGLSSGRKFRCASAVVVLSTGRAEGWHRTRLARIGLSLIITYVALHAAETLLIWPDWSGCRRTHIRRSTGHDGQFILNGRGGFHTHLASSRCCFVNDRRESLSDCLDIFPPAPYCSNHRCAEGGLAAAQKEFGRASCLQHRKAPTRMRSGVHEGHRRVSSSLKISELT